MKDRSPEQRTATDPTTGCLGCASGPGAGPRNIFGNKYGQYLATVQVAREARIAGAKEQRKKEEEERTGNDETDNDSDTDSGGDDGVWAGSGRVGTKATAKQRNRLFLLLPREPGHEPAGCVQRSRVRATYSC
ncbi:unnamed protein product [Pseudo-nitzschia multistriata]|uniref:Uncharacterized protein n=1 Tax=Pseudo-nitzschia multistriata TaxID=183589 RepID=A0A448ZG47_9STRA|nr:unnamed protein product [Pseudo-nitzschia multistriata]